MGQNINYCLENKELFSLADFHVIDKPLGSEEGEYVSLTDWLGEGWWGDGYVIHKNMFSFIIK